MLVAFLACNSKARHFLAIGLSWPPPARVNSCFCSFLCTRKIHDPSPRSHLHLASHSTWFALVPSGETSRRRGAETSCSQIRTMSIFTSHIWTPRWFPGTLTRARIRVALYLVTATCTDWSGTTFTLSRQGLNCQVHAAALFTKHLKRLSMLKSRRPVASSKGIEKRPRFL